MEKVEDFKNQLIKVISLLEQEQKKDPSNMINLMLKRYKNALSTVEKKQGSFANEDFFIKGAPRAYLDVSSDYTKPFLEEMYKAEKLLEKVTK